MEDASGNWLISAIVFDEIYGLRAIGGFEGKYSSVEAAMVCTVLRESSAEVGVSSQGRVGRACGGKEENQPSRSV